MSTGRPSAKEGHVLFRQNAGDDTLVPVTAGHLVAHGQLTLDGDMNLDHLDHAGGQIVPFRDLFALGVVDRLDVLDLVIVLHKQFARRFR